jgi:hypothetical protein
MTHYTLALLKLFAARSNSATVVYDIRAQLLSNNLGNFKKSDESKLIMASPSFFYAYYRVDNINTGEWLLTPDEATQFMEQTLQSSRPSSSYILANLLKAANLTDVKVDEPADQKLKRYYFIIREISYHILTGRSIVYDAIALIRSTIINDPILYKRSTSMIFSKNNEHYKQRRKAYEYTLTLLAELSKTESIKCFIRRVLLDAIRRNIERQLTTGR